MIKEVRGYNTWYDTTNCNRCSQLLEIKSVVLRGGHGVSANKENDGKEYFSEEYRKSLLEQAWKHFVCVHDKRCVFG